MDFVVGAAVEILSISKYPVNTQKNIRQIEVIKITN